jgi:hypothetical protein
MATTMAPPIPTETPGEPFTGEVVVRQVDDDPEFKSWTLVEPLTYRGKWDTWTVRSGFCTDFASVPRVVTWLIPRYGRYTKAAILHDYLCTQAEVGKIDRADADGVFRRALRELGVAFLRRWLMWAAVRLDAARTRPSTLWRKGPRPFLVWLLLAVPGLLFALVPGAAILLALGVFFLAECIVLPLLRESPRRPAGVEPPKQVNEPRSPWTT